MPAPALMTPPAAEAAAQDDGVPAAIRYHGRPDEPARLDVVRRTPRERALRAAQGWAFCWAAAVAAVFIPLLHFILVPSLLIAGPLVGRARWNEHATLRRLRGRCPGCGEDLAVPLDGPLRAQVSWRCARCGRPLLLCVDPALIAPPGGRAEAAG